MANDRIDAVKELVSNGANVSAQTLSSKTALVLALERNFIEVSIHLLGENWAAAAVHEYEEKTLGTDYDEYLLDPTHIQYDPSHDTEEGFWLDSPIGLKLVEGGYPINVTTELERWSRLNHPHVMKLYGVCRRLKSSFSSMSALRTHLCLATCSIPRKMTRTRLCGASFTTLH